MTIDNTMNTWKKRILVVDDQSRDSRLLKLYLEGTNDYVVREENDAQPSFPRRRNFSRT